MHDFEDLLQSLEAISSQVEHNRIKSWGNQEATKAQKDDANNLVKELVLRIKKNFSAELNEEVSISLSWTSWTDLNSDDKPTLYSKCIINTLNKSGKEIILENIYPDLKENLEEIKSSLEDCLKQIDGDGSLNINL